MMPYTTTCEHCGFSIRFEEEDRGVEVYCDSCGRANLIPPAPELDQPPARDTRPAESVPEVIESDHPAAEPAESAVPPEEEPSGAEPQAVAPSTVTVFSASGAAELDEQVVGEETCLCGAKIPVRVEDHGGTVYCPSCAAEIQVGSTLAEGKYRVAHEVQEEEAQPKSIPVRKPRLRLISSPLGVAAMLFVMASAALGGYFTWQHPQKVLTVVRSILPLPGPPPTKPPPDYVPPPGPGPVTPPPPNLVPDPPITVEMVEALLTDADLTEALVQAQVWQETLRDQEVGDDDLRLIKLAEVIEILSSKLAPKPEGPLLELVEFRRLVQAIAEALKAGNLEAARKALDHAEDFLRKHDDALAPYCQRFLALKLRLRNEEAQIAGVNRIRQLLENADQAQAAGRVTEALEAEAEAKFLALSTPAPKEEFDKLDDKERQLMDNIQFARGKRAVEDAQRCHEARDIPARNREVNRVFSLLPGLPESKVNPLLDQVRPWKEDAESTEERSGATKKSALAREIELRDRYEATLIHYGNADCSQLALACLELEKLLPDEEQSKQKRQQIERMLFDVLERDVTRKLQALEEAKEEVEFLQELSEIRRILDQATPWQTSHRWKALDGAVRQQGNRLAQGFLNEAIALAEEDKLEEAVERAAQAEKLGRSEVARQAATFRQQWQAELKLRADQKVQADSWQRIRTLRGQRGKELELWNELQLFSRRFPRSPQAGEIRRLTKETRRLAEEKTATALEYAERLLEDEEWEEFRKYMEHLQAAPVSDARRRLFDKLAQRARGLKQRATNEFLLLGKHKRLVTENDVLVAIPALTAIVAMDPNHEEARALLERAKRQAEIRADKLLRTAPHFKTVRPKLYVDKLRRAVRLDPDGPYGKKAHQLLSEP